MQNCKFIVHNCLLIKAVWRRKTRENKPWLKKVISTFKCLCPIYIKRESSYSTVRCLQVTDRSPLFLQMNRYICAKQKHLTLMLPHKQTLQLMPLYTSSRMWLTAHTPINQAVIKWLIPLRHPKSMCAIVQLLSNYWSQIYTYIKLLKGVTCCTHLNNCVCNWDFWSCSKLVSNRMPVQQHLPIQG